MPQPLMDITKPPIPHPQPGGVNLLPVAPSGDTSLLRMRSNAEMDKETAATATIEIMDADVQDSLAAHIRNDFQSAKQTRQPIEDQMFTNLRQVEGKYDPGQDSAISSTGGSDIYVMLTDQKCRDAEAWIRDVLEQAGGKTWSLEPEPVDDLPPDLANNIIKKVAAKLLVEAQANPQAAMVNPGAFAQELGSRLSEVKEAARSLMHLEAERRTKEMEKKIETQFDEGGFTNALSEVIIDLTRYKIAILKGPIPRKTKSLKWVRGTGNRWALEAREIIKLEYARVNPFNFYPLTGVTNIQKGGLIEFHQLTRTDLQGMIGLPGYNDAAIRAVLDEYGPGGHHDFINLTTSSEEAIIRDEDSLQVMTSDRIDALQYWNTVSGKLLREWGMSTRQIPDVSREYPVEAWLISSHVIKCVMNPDPLGGKPYSTTGFAKEPGTVWHKSLPESVRPDQVLCNATARAIHNNVGVAAGPQVEINKDRVAIGGDSSRIWPFKVWAMTEGQSMSGGQAVHFYQPNMVSDKLLQIYQHFKSEADAHSRIPSYAKEGTGGAGQTASGLSMLMTMDSRGVKMLVSNLDEDVIRPTVERTFSFNMLYDEDADIKGDASVKVRGIHAIVAKEQLAVRRKELFRDTAGSQVDLQIMGIEGRAALLKNILHSLEIPWEEIIRGVPAGNPDDAYMPQLGQPAQPGQAQPGQPGQSAGTPAPGMSPAGGSPQGATQLDLAGSPVSGTDTRTFGGGGTI